MWEGGYISKSCLWAQIIGTYNIILQLLKIYRKESISFGKLIELGYTPLQSARVVYLLKYPDFHLENCD